MDLLYHLTGKNLIDLWKKEVITSLLFCTKASLWKDLVTGFFLLKKPATPPRAIALRLSSPLLKKEVITSLLFCTKASLLVTNNSSPSLGIFATPARCFLWSENIAPPHKSEKDWRSPVFLGSRFCAPWRIRTSDHLLKRELLYQLS